MGWLDGALRVMPSWEWVGWGHTIPLEVFLPAVIFPGLIFNILLAWPLIEWYKTKDSNYHNLLDRPRDRPKRTAAGAAMLALLFGVFFASSTDVMANFFQLPLMDVLWFFRFFVPLAPIVAYFITFKICHEMRDAENIGKRKRALIVSRTTDGEYVTAESAPRPGDGHEELEAMPVPTFIDTTDPELATAAGVRRVIR
jgi:ubiquinol-cytochrome c reductase cytochrome b subunit